MHTQKTIIELLKRQPHTVRQLAEHFETSRQAISYHVKNLVDRRIAKCRVEERERPTDGALMKVKVYWIG